MAGPLYQVPLSVFGPFSQATEDGDMPSFLILVQEPAPGSAPDPGAANVDEEHQRLPDGMLLHVTYWKHSPARAALVGDPALEGWQQIRIASPFPPMEGP